MRIIITKELELEPEELGFLLDKKPDSKDVKAVFAEIENEAAQRLESRKSSAKAETKPVEPVPEPVIEKKPEQKPVPDKKKNQASLFDF